MVGKCRAADEHVGATWHRFDDDVVAASGDGIDTEQHPTDRDAELPLDEYGDGSCNAGVVEDRSGGVDDTAGSVHERIPSDDVENRSEPTRHRRRPSVLDRGGRTDHQWRG